MEIGYRILQTGEIKHENKNSHHFWNAPPFFSLSLSLSLPRKFHAAACAAAGGLSAASHSSLQNLKAERRVDISLIVSPMQFPAESLRRPLPDW